MLTSLAAVELAAEPEAEPEPEAAEPLLAAPVLPHPKSAMDIARAIARANTFFFMATAVIMPRQGQSVESCLLSEWKKAEGDEVHTGDILFTYETDKAMFEEAAKVDGTLLAVFCQEGDDIPCLDTVAVIGAPGEDFSSLIPASAETAAPAEAKKAALPAETPVNSLVTTAAVGAAVSVSPRARNTAERLHVALTDLAPSGPHGRVLERDVLAGRKLTAAALEGGDLSGIAGTGVGGRIRAADLSAPASAPEAAAAAPAGGGTGYHDEKLSHLRKVIGASMMQSALNGTDPVIFLESQRIYDYGELFHKEGVPQEEYEITLGEPDVKRFGSDVTILSIGATLYRAVKAADILQEKYGLSAEVIDARSLVPFNYEKVIESVKKTGRIVITGDACERNSIMKPEFVIDHGAEAPFYKDGDWHRMYIGEVVEAYHV